MQLIEELIPFKGGAPYSWIRLYLGQRRLTILDVTVSQDCLGNFEKGHVDGFGVDRGGEGSRLG